MTFHRVEDYKLVVHDKQRRYKFYDDVRHPDAQIVVYTDDGFRFRLYFLPDDEELPKHKVAGDKRASIFFFARQYTWCVDLLRNEGPQSVFWDETNAYLATGREPAGPGDDWH